MRSRLRLVSALFAIALGLIGCRGDPPFQSHSADDWRELLERGNTVQRIHAAAAFANAPPHTFENVRALLAAANDPDPLVREAAGAAIKALPPAAVDALIRALDDANVLIRRRAAVALSEFPTLAEQSIGPLTHALDDTDDSVRALAMRSLAALGPARKPPSKR